MREGIERPRARRHHRLPLAAIDELPDGGVRIGAMVRNSHLAPTADSRALSVAVAGDPVRRVGANAEHGDGRRQPACSGRAATTSMMAPRAATSGARQRLRRDRKDSTGFTRSSARRRHCIATHPSDMCVALAALDATVNVAGPAGTRSMPFAEFHRLPGETPHIDTNLQAGELITSVDLPRAASARRVGVPQGAGSRQLRLRAGLRCRGVARGGWRRA